MPKNLEKPEIESGKWLICYPLLTCPTCHAMISGVSEGNVDITRININNVGQILWRNKPGRPELRQGLSTPAKPMAELGRLDEKRRKRLSQSGCEGWKWFRCDGDLWH